MMDDPVVTPGIVPFDETVPIEPYVAALEQQVKGNPILLRLWADTHRRGVAGCLLMNRPLLAQHYREASDALEARADAIEAERPNG